MVRRSGELCKGASPRRCHECFPDISPGDFFPRERFIKSHMQHVDMFLAPSQFLLERYVDWGIPREKIRFEEYGRLPQQPHPAIPQPADEPRNRIAFFGQLNHYKGVDVLLNAMTLLDARGVDAHLSVHGANLDLQSPEFQAKFMELLDATTRSANNVTLEGSYDHEDLPRLMAEVDWVVVPSRWWENSPLVIQEAFIHGKPVICSDIGGMAEKVSDGVNGLHFRVGNATSLAATLERAILTPGLWEDLHGRLPAVYGMDDHISSLGALYANLLEGSAARAGHLTL
jgi:glycosyltransferase involved in cell wall biosynthesis